MYVEETVHHFLLECDGLSAQRRTLMNNILTVMPPAMAESFQSLAYEQQTQFLLGELGRTLMPELFHVHSAVIRLVHELYSTRNSLLKDEALN
jgi:Mn2+/Fe2+ NRAMP family transporter